MVDIKFIKMHGLGNDFVIIDAQEQTFTLNSDLLLFSVIQYTKLIGIIVFNWIIG